MKTLKKIFIILLIIIAIPLIVALFVPKEFKSERTIVINKPKNEVFEYVRYVKNQDNYGVWQLSDPDMKKEYKGTDGTPGFVYRWESESMGNGTQTITNIAEGTRIDSELDFGFGTPAKAYIITKEKGEGTTEVTWGITGRTPYPFNIMSLFYDMGDDFRKGLENLKKELEK